MGSSHGLRVHHAQLVGAGVFPRPPSHVSHSLSLRLPALRLTLLRMVTRGLIMQKACRNLSAATACGHAISGLFHSPHGVLFTFPSRYSFTIGHRRVFRLGEWAPRIQAGFHVSRLTQDTARPRKGFGYGAVTLCGRPFQAVPLPLRCVTSPSYNPRGQAPWFGLFRVRSPLLAESQLISFPRGTEMFHFPRYRSNRSIYSNGGFQV